MLVRRVRRWCLADVQPTEATASKNQEDFKKKTAASRKSKAEANLKKYPPGHKLHTQAKRELAQVYEKLIWTI